MSSHFVCPVNSKVIISLLLVHILWLTILSSYYNQSAKHLCTNKTSLSVPLRQPFSQIFSKIQIRVHPHGTLIPANRYSDKIIKDTDVSLFSSLLNLSNLLYTQHCTFFGLDQVWTQVTKCEVHKMSSESSLKYCSPLLF